MSFWMKWSKEKRLPSWFFGVVIGTVMLGIGMYYDQFTDIYRKAVLICLECIGIG